MTKYLCDKCKVEIRDIIREEREEYEQTVVKLHNEIFALKCRKVEKLFKPIFKYEL